MAVDTITRYLKPFTTFLIDAGDLGRVVCAIEMVMKYRKHNRGHGTVTVIIVDGKITEVDMFMRDRGTDDPSTEVRSMPESCIRK